MSRKGSLAPWVLRGVVLESMLLAYTGGTRWNTNMADRLRMN